MTNKRLVRAIHVAVILAVVTLPLSAGGHGEHAPAGREGDAPVNNAWIRASAPGDSNGAGYMIIRNRANEAIRLVAARPAEELAARVEIHTHTMRNGLMRMEQVPYVEVPANGEAVFEPGGNHLMFMGLREPFEEGDYHRIVLEFENHEPIEVDFIVEPINYRGPEMDHNH